MLNGSASFSESTSQKMWSPELPISARLVKWRKTPPILKLIIIPLNQVFFAKVKLEGGGVNSVKN